MEPAQVIALEPCEGCRLEGYAQIRRECRICWALVLSALVELSAERDTLLYLLGRCEPFLATRDAEVPSFLCAEVRAVIARAIDSALEGE